MVGHMHTVRCLQVNYSLGQLFTVGLHLILRQEGEAGQTTSSPSFTKSVMHDTKENHKKKWLCEILVVRCARKEGLVLLSRHKM